MHPGPSFVRASWHSPPCRGEKRRGRATDLRGPQLLGESSAGGRRPEGRRQLEACSQGTGYGLGPSASLAKSCTASRQKNCTEGAPPPKVERSSWVNSAGKATPPTLWRTARRLEGAAFGMGAPVWQREGARSVIWSMKTIDYVVGFVVVVVGVLIVVVVDYIAVAVVRVFRR